MGGADAAHGEPLKILLAEDNPVNRDIATRMLRRLGHEIDLAADGFESVQKGKARLYDVILMDMQMPDMDGLQATRIIRKLPPPHGQVPIIAVTANAFPTDRQACLEAGMNDFVAKPVTRDKLAAALQPWAGRQAPAPEEIGIPASARHALVDERHFASVAQELGDTIFGDLLAMFWTSIPKARDELQSALDHDDPEAADRALHRLKGSAANFGFVGCQAACDDIRAQIRTQGLSALGEALPMLLETCRATERLAHLGAHGSAEIANGGDAA
jgi:CheY-like chemotaxis protein/HPt (histidine-containing phosphotransfer) domain-containing protein